ncbi:anaerobic ribonucleoside-triphosphate reductase activating protein [Verrucomicrobiota bacterium]
MKHETPIYAFLQRPSMVDFPGHMAAVFFTSGCNFKCGFCHNAPLMGNRRKGLTWEKLAAVCEDFKNDWVTGVVISGGEPTLFAELPELIKFFRKYGFAVKLDTNGSNPELLKECLPLVDYVAMDLKTAVDDYQNFVGWGNPDKIRQSFEMMKAEAKDYEFRTTIVENYHTDELIEQAGKDIEGAKRLILQAFVPKDELPDPEYCKMKRTSAGRMKELATLARPYAEEVIVRGA